MSVKGGRYRYWLGTLRRESSNKSDTYNMQSEPVCCTYQTVAFCLDAQRSEGFLSHLQYTGAAVLS